MGTNSTNALIDNDYVMELPVRLDVTKLKQIVDQALGTSTNHQYMITDYPYLQQVQKAIPILGWRWNIYKFPPHKGLDVHVDARRKACINIPISGYDTSVTSFFKEQTNMTTVYDPVKVLYNVQDSLEKVFSFTLRKPTLIRNTVPHSAYAGDETRVIISWGLCDNMDFFEAKQHIAALADVVIAGA
jgi:hypothetical protein